MAGLCRDTGQPVLRCRGRGNGGNGPERARAATSGVTVSISTASEARFARPDGDWRLLPGPAERRAGPQLAPRCHLRPLGLLVAGALAGANAVAAGRSRRRRRAAAAPGPRRRPRPYGGVSTGYRVPSRLNSGTRSHCRSDVTEPILVTARKPGDRPTN